VRSLIGSHEDDREQTSGRRQLTAQFDAGAAVQINIQYQTKARVRIRQCAKCVHRAECTGVKSVDLQQSLNAAQNPRVIVHDENRPVPERFLARQESA